MNYLRDFYKQSGKYQVSLNYTDLGVGSANFGLSGANTFGFNVTSGLVYCEGYPVSAVDETESIFLTIVGDGFNSTAWIDNKPVFTKPGSFSFKNIYCSSAHDFSFNETLMGIQPELTTAFSGWSGQTGYMYIVNNGDDTLEIDSISLEGSYIRVNSYESSIAPGGSGLVELFYPSNSTTSGTGQLALETNAGDYNLGQFLGYEWVNNLGDLDMYFEGGFYNPTGSSKFFIQNRYQRDIDVELFLDDDDFYIITDDSGVILLSDIDDEFYLYEQTSRYATILGTGQFTLSINTSITGPTTFPVSYSGMFTGIGGRLGATGTGVAAGTANLVVYPEGNLVYEYSVPASSIISGDVYLGNLTGLLTGLVGPGSGVYHFFGPVSGSVDFAYNSTTFVGIIPSVLASFTGQVDNTLDLETSVIGDYNYLAYENVEVFEGYGEYIDLWEIDVYDVDRGTENLKTLGRYTTKGFGITGVTYRIPEGGRISGEVRYNNPYQRPILSKMALRVNDYTSINQQISIESR